ncbi:MAG: malto-oligosyltrehalose trehalohydrolase, partial [Chryseosolibacter sp.]
GEVDGYYEDFGETSHLAKSLKDGYVYTGQYSKHRKKLFGKEPVDNTFDQFVVFAQNHDQTGNRMLGDRLTSLVSFEGLKLSAATYLLSPFVPMLFMGEEYGEKNPFQYFISHTDKTLVELVRKGRKEEFSYFKWEGEIPDPQSEKTFNQCVLSWDVEQDMESRALFALYRHLIDFRKKRTAMKGKGRDALNVLSAENGLICFERKHQHDAVLVVLNFNKGSVSFTPPAGQDTLKKIFDTASGKWGGPGNAEYDQPSPNKPIHVHPQSALILEY